MRGLFTTRGARRSALRQSICVLVWLLVLDVGFAQDYGDAPDGAAGAGPGNYLTRAADSGPRHTISGNLRLGAATTDNDGGTLQNAAATADDTNGTADEDGIASFPPLRAVAGQTYTVNVSVRNQSGANAFLVGYIDFNRDGIFSATSERSNTLTVATSTTNPRTVTLTFTVPIDAELGTSYARFRISSNQAHAESPSGPTTGLSTGEVEDYQVLIEPLLAISRTTTSTTTQNNMVTHRIKVWNRSTAPVTGATLVNTLAASLANGSWYCYARGSGSRCQGSLTTALGSGNLNLVLGSLPTNNTATPPKTGGYLEFVITATARTVSTVANTAATLTAPSSLGGDVVSSSATTTTVTAVQTICAAAGGTRTTNLFANGGSFGTLSGTPTTDPPTRQSLPAGRTNYIYNTRVPAAFPTNYSPEDGEYDLTNSVHHRQDGRWYMANGHTTGLATDLMMLVNASIEPGVFYEQTLTVTPNQIYEFSAWVMNVVANSGYPILPNIQFEVDRIGVDDDGDPTTSDGQEEQTVAVSGNIPNSNDVLWRNYGAFISSGTATQITVRLRNNQGGGNGNDLALDDLVFAPCNNVPTGTVSGFVYADLAANNTRDGSDRGLGRVTVLLRDTATTEIVGTTQTSSNGSYFFTMIPGTYTLEVASDDSDLPTDSVLGTPNDLAVTLTSSGSFPNRNFGFDLQPRVGVAKAFISIQQLSTDPASPDYIRYTLLYRIVVQNFGEVALNNIEIRDDVLSLFSGLNPTAIAAVSDTAQVIPNVGTCSVLTRNTSYNGSATANLVVSSSLNAGACGTILVRFTVTVDHLAASNNLLKFNVATARGTSPAGLISAFDDSEQGTDPDPNGDNDPAEGSGTRATFIKIVKEVRNCGTNPSWGQLICQSSYSFTSTGKPGDYIEYRLTLYNISSTFVPEVRVTDSIPNNTLFHENFNFPGAEFSVICTGSPSYIDVDKSNPAVTLTLSSGRITAFSLNLNSENVVPVAPSICGTNPMAPRAFAQVHFLVQIQ